MIHNYFSSSINIILYWTQCPEKDCIRAILLAGIKEVVYHKINDSDAGQLATAKTTLGSKLR